MLIEVQGFLFWKFLINKVFEDTKEIWVNKKKKKREVLIGVQNFLFWKFRINKIIEDTKEIWFFKENKTFDRYFYNSLRLSVLEEIEILKWKRKMLWVLLLNCYILVF